MRIGATIRVAGGPFCGLYGTVVRSSARRTVLAVVFENREVEIEIDQTWAVTATPRRRSTTRTENPDVGQRRTG